VHVQQELVMKAVNRHFCWGYNQKRIFKVLCHYPHTERW